MLARARRLAGMCSAIIVSDTGMQAPSPRPATRRSAANIHTDVASGTTRVKTENSTTEPMSSRRRPSRSASGPTQTAPMATPTRESVAMVVASAAVMPR